VEKVCDVCGGSMAHRTSRALRCSVECNNKAGLANRTAKRMAARAGRSCKRCGDAIPTDLRVATDFCSQQCRRAWRHADKGRVYQRSRLYGLTPDDYAEMISQQDNRCAICGTMEWGGKSGEPHIDHDHITGEVRGLLCASCNYGLGCFKDESKRLRVDDD
jgi:hypothetical protein